MCYFWLLWLTAAYLKCLVAASVLFFLPMVCMMSFFLMTIETATGRLMQVCWCLRFLLLWQVFASEATLSATNQCLQIMGGHGYMKTHPNERHVRDARVLSIYEVWGYSGILLMFTPVVIKVIFCEVFINIVSDLWSNHSPLNLTLLLSSVCTLQNIQTVCAIIVHFCNNKQYVSSMVSWSNNWQWTNMEDAYWLCLLKIT